MRIIISALLFLVVFASSALAAGTISGYSGTVSDGESVTISGSSFGSGPTIMEWTGANIEAGTDGVSFSKTGWDNNNSGFPEEARYDNSRYYSGSKSIIFDSTTESDGRFDLVYDFGSPQDFFYISWVAYIDVNSATGQWKMFRLNWEHDVQDTGPEVILFNWFGSSDQFIVRRESGETAQRLYPSGCPGSDAWYRMEMYLQPSSDFGEADCSVQVWVHSPGSSITQIVNQTSYTSYFVTETDEWRYAVFQNYQGNGLGGSSVVWNDDIYLSNSKARVELGNASTWGACTQREIQPYTAWGTGQISVTINQGTYSAEETAYLFVVDENGDASNGYEVTIGSGEPPPESEYTGLVYQ